MAKSNELCSRFGEMIEAYATNVLKSFEGVSFCEGTFNLNERTAEKKETLSRLANDDSLHGKVITKIAEYAIEHKRSAYGSCGINPRCRNVDIDTTIFMRTVYEFLSPTQCLALAIYFVKKKDKEQTKKE